MAELDSKTQTVLRMSKLVEVRDAIHKIFQDEPFSIPQLIKRTSLNQKTALQHLQELGMFGLVTRVKNPLKKRMDFRVVTEDREIIELIKGTVDAHRKYAETYSQIADNFQQLINDLESVTEPIEEKTEPKKRGPRKKLAVVKDE